MYTRAQATTIEPEKIFVVPSLSEEHILRLPRYFKPNRNNLATQYYYLFREFAKENTELREQLQKTNDKLAKAKKEIADLQEKAEKLKSERDKFRDQLFKFSHRKSAEHIKHEPIIRTEESYTRPTPKTIDEYKTAELKQCPLCESELSESVDSYQRIVEDIPSYEQLKVKTTQYQIHRYYCKHCKKIISAKPKDVLPKSRFGINVLLNVLHGKYRLRLSHNLICENLKTQFNLKIADGEITNLLEKGSLAFSAKWQEIIETVKHSKTINGDETSWRTGSDNSWLWAFVADKAVRYTITETRGKGNAEQVLGKDYDGVVISDFYAAYNQFKNKQRCWVHLLRKARELCQEKPQDKDRQKLKNKLSRIYQDVLLFRLRENATKEERNTKAGQIKNQLENLRDILRIKSGFENNQNLQKQLNLCKKFAGELVVCVSDFAVSPENNIAERAIRPAVLMRKISGGSRSAKGAKIHETNLSVIETLLREDQGQDLYPAMKNLILSYLASGE